MRAELAFGCDLRRLGGLVRRRGVRRPTLGTRRLLGVDIEITMLGPGFHSFKHFPHRHLPEG